MNSKADTTHKNSVQPVSCKKRQEAKQVLKSKVETTRKIVYSQCLAQKARGKISLKSKADTTHENSVQPVELKARRKTNYKIKAFSLPHCLLHFKRIYLQYYC